MYKASEFAGRAGVTVRTLHHYDRLGLLKPARTVSGYRVYGETDFVRLAQIVTLKFVGFPLNQIKRLLDQRALDLPSVLKLQRKFLLEKQRHIDKAIEALDYAERSVSSGTATIPDAICKVTEAIERANNFEWTSKYYSSEAKHFLSKRRQKEPDAAERGTRAWQCLIADIETAIREKVKPTSKRGAMLASRWRELVHDFTEGNTEVEAGLKRMWADQKNWPENLKKPYSDAVAGFIAAAGVRCEPSYERKE